MENEEKKHYESLLSYFKYLITITGAAITLMTGAALYYSYNSLKDLKDELKLEATEIKSRAMESIENTRTQTTNEIMELKIEARDLTIKTTQFEINKAFEQNNIKKLIEDIAENKLTYKLGFIVKQETKKLEQIFQAIPILTTAYEQARWEGSARKYIDTLYYYSENGTHELTRLLAKEFLLQKGRDYENYYIEYYKTFSQDSLLVICEKSLGLKAIEANLSKLYYISMKDEDLEKITQAFICVRKVTNGELANFDFARLKELIKI